MTERLPSAEPGPQDPAEPQDMVSAQGPHDAWVDPDTVVVDPGGLSYIDPKLAIGEYGDKDGDEKEDQ